MLTEGRFWGVFFVDLSSQEAAEKSLLAMPNVCHLGDTIEAFKKHLTNSSLPWLLILDNADDPSLEIAQYFPAGNRGTILATTRNVQCRMYATIGYTELRDMDSDEAIDLLLRSADLDGDHEQLRDSALLIVRTLGFLPLAIAQAGASILQGICTIADYLEIYERSRTKLFSERSLQVTAAYEYTVYTTWEISVRSIREQSENEQSDTASDALELLNLFGFFHFNNITEEIFNSAWKTPVSLNEDPWWESKLPRLLQGERHASWNPLEFREAIGLLSRYSLIQISHHHHQISIHPLMHSWIRDSLSEEAQRNCWSTTMLIIALASKCQAYRFLSQPVLHAIHCLTTRDPEVYFVEGDFAFEMIEIATNLLDLSIKTKREKYFLVFAEMAVAYSRKFLGDCASTCKIAEGLAKIYVYTYNYQKGSDLLEEWLSVSTRVVGFAEWITMSMMYLLAKAYKETDRIPEALQLARSSVALLEESVLFTNPWYSEALATLASIDCSMGHDHSALKHLEDEVNSMERSALYSYRTLKNKYGEGFSCLLEPFGYDFGYICGVIFNLGRIYRCIGQAERGTSLIVRAIDIGTTLSVIDDFVLHYWREELECIPPQSQDSSRIETHEPSSLQRTEQKPRTEPKSRMKWRLWPKRRRQIEESSS